MKAREDATSESVAVAKPVLQDPSALQLPCKPSTSGGVVSSGMKESNNGRELPSSEVFVGIGMLILEGRVPGLTNRGYGEGPHIGILNPPTRHVCDHSKFLCERRERFEAYMLLLWENSISMCVEVLLAPDCQHGRHKAHNTEPSIQPDPSFVLLEQWTVQIVTRGPEAVMTDRSLLLALRSYLHFSQLSAWFSQSGGILPTNVLFRITVPGEQFASTFPHWATPDLHQFPVANVGKKDAIKVTVRALPRTTEVPVVICVQKQEGAEANLEDQSSMRPKVVPGDSEDALCRSRTLGCRQTGKHLCSDVPVQVDEYPPPKFGDPECGRRVKKKLNRCEDDESRTEMDSVLRSLRERQPCGGGKRTPRERSPATNIKVAPSSSSSSRMTTSKSTPSCGTRHLLESIMRRRGVFKHTSPPRKSEEEEEDKIVTCQTCYRDQQCGPIPIPPLPMRLKELSCQKSSFRDCQCPSVRPKEKNNNRKCSPPPEYKENVNLLHQDIDNVSASLKRLDFHNRTKKNPPHHEPYLSEVYSEEEGLVLRTKVSDKANVARVLQFTEKDEEEGNKYIQQKLEKSQEGPRPKPPSPAAAVEFRRSLDSAIGMVFHQRTGLPLTSSPAPLRRGTAFNYDSSLNSPHAIKSALLEGQGGDKSCVPVVTSSSLLGNFEESVLNGRLEPVSTVAGFTAEIGASGQFQPAHITVPVTVFFYSLCNSQQLSSPYLAHINLGKRGYRVPSTGTIQVTLFNPHRTVVKMWVVSYNLCDMPPMSQTFIRQRTLYMPLGSGDRHPDAHQWLRYLIHLRFHTSKSGKLYLHTDIRMIIFRKSDVDAATLHRGAIPYELRSFTHQPVNPKYSPLR